MSRALISAIARYLDRRAIHRQYPLQHPALDHIDQVVVIPAFTESQQLPHTLDDLASNDAAELARTLVICVVNNRAEPHASRHEIEDNLLTLGMLQGSCRRWPELRLAWIDAASPGRELGRRDGVGTARRIGLDAALAVLADNHHPTGLLISLDADARVEPGYLAAIRQHFADHSSWAAVVNFAHPLPDDAAHRLTIAGYELFLRYHVLGLAAAGSPFAHHSIGSTMVCTGQAYAAVGGMCRRQAGEDFYFLQQLAKTGGVTRMTTTTVRPSPRPSRRVPFGTGASVQRLLGDGGGSTPLYDPESYTILRRWLELLEQGMGRDGDEILEQALAIAPQLGQFLSKAGITTAWRRIHHNAPDTGRLRAQLHRWFDGFSTLKLIHHLREHGHPDQPPSVAVPRLLELADCRTPPDVRWAAVDHDPDAMVALLRWLRHHEQQRAARPSPFARPTAATQGR